MTEAGTWNSLGSWNSQFHRRQTLCPLLGRPPSSHEWVLVALEILNNFVKEAHNHFSLGSAIIATRLSLFTSNLVVFS